MAIDLETTRALLLGLFPVQHGGRLLELNNDYCPDVSVDDAGSLMVCLRRR
jgi:hypothetical protein